jgi:hypothetical protein
MGVRVDVPYMPRQEKKGKRKKKYNFDLWIGIAYILYMTGWSITSVGTLSSTKPFTWDIVLVVFWFVTVPFYFGFMAGKKWAYNSVTEIIHEVDNIDKKAFDSKKLPQGRKNI